MAIQIKLDKKVFGDPFRFSLGELNTQEVSHCVYNGSNKVIAEGSEKECGEFISEKMEQEMKRIELIYLIRYAIGHYFFKKGIDLDIYLALDGGVCYSYCGIHHDGIPLFPVLEFRVIEEKARMQRLEPGITRLREKFDS